MTRARLQHGVERGVVQRDESLRMLQRPAPAADLCSRQWVWRARGRTHLVTDERDARTPQHAQATLERVRKVSKLVELLHRQRRLRPQRLESNVLLNVDISMSWKIFAIFGGARAHLHCGEFLIDHANGLVEQPRDAPQRREQREVDQRRGLDALRQHSPLLRLERGHGRWNKFAHRP